MVYTFLIAFLASSLIITLYLGIIISVRCESKHTPMYLAMLTACFLYILGYLLEITATSTDSGLTANKVLYIGSVYISPCVLMISASMCEVKIKRAALPFIFIIPLIFVLFAWTASRHTLLWSTYEFVTSTEIPHLYVTPGSLYFLPHTHMLACVITSVVFIVRRLRSSDVQHRTRFYLILVGTLTPVFFLGLYVAGLRVFGIDYTPLAIIVSNILFYIAITKYGFLDFLPLASEMALHSINEAYVLIDNHHRYLTANESAKNVFPGLRELNIYTPIRDVENWPGPLMPAEDGHLESSVRFALPGDLYYKANVSEITSQKGDILGYIILIADITESILYETRIHEEKTRAERANQSKSNFLATISHEIRTPLNAITGISEIQLQNEKLPKEYAAAFSRIYSSSKILLGIINDLLDLSKVEAGKITLNPVEYALPTLINDTTHLNIVRLGSKHLEFIVDVDEALPSKLIGDELRLKQILNNLLSNAIKYTQKGYVKLSVSAETNGNLGDDMTLVFTVEDTGKGMTDEEQVLLFHEYTRFKNPSERPTEGTGLGLAITRQLALLMGGSVEVQSNYGEGSVFTVKVRQKTTPCEPIGKDVAQKLKSFSLAQDYQWQQETCDAMAGGRVLVVDDIEINLLVAAEMLSLFKPDIDTASSGFEAIRKIENNETYDVIFMDYIMPEMDGVETTRKLREMGYTAPIVALSADALVGNAEMFKENGFDDFIPKPLEIKALKAILQKFVKGADLEVE